MPFLHCKSEEKDSDGSSDACRHGGVEDLAEVPCPKGYLCPFEGEVARVSACASHSDAMQDDDAIRGV